MKKLLLCAFGVLLLQSCESEEPLENQELSLDNYSISKQVDGNFLFVNNNTTETLTPNDFNILDFQNDTFGFYVQDTGVINSQVSKQDMGLLSTYEFFYTSKKGYTLNFQTLQKCTAHIEDENGVVIIYVTPDENGSNSFDFNLDRPEGFQFAFDQNLGNDNSRARVRQPEGDTNGGG
jgi:hypothetical protein